MVVPLFRFSAIVAVAVVLAGCSSRRDAPVASGPLTGSPPAAKEGEVHRVNLTLEGGNFPQPRKLEISLAPPSAKLETFADGFRLSVADPALAGNNQPHAWGFWLFSDGQLKEDGFLRLRTGTQLVIDGISYAPGAKPKSQPQPNNHEIEATLEITRFEPERGIFEAEFSAPLFAPDGKTTVQAKGSMSLPWPTSTTGQAP
ncbi:MAG: hypothetical protein ACKO2G_00140 [Verrucomicrobiales bacterium]